MVAGRVAVAGGRCAHGEPYMVDRVIAHRREVARLR
jgi:hypothetical protein